MIFIVANDLARIKKIDSKSFVSLNIWERQHIEDWVCKSPEILGEDLLIVSTEFDRFEGSRDRLDLLAIDRKGSLVVIELKRDLFAGYADLQSIRYAAMISAMTIEKLLPYYITYQKKIPWTRKCYRGRFQN
jgi:RecB family endonuclease NucS